MVKLKLTNINASLYWSEPAIHYIIFFCVIKTLEAMESNLKTLIHKISWTEPDKVTINGKNSEIANITNGVPQGSTLGLILFLIYINDIHFELPDIKLDKILFADDSTISFEETKLDLLGQHLSDSQFFFF